MDDGMPPSKPPSSSQMLSLSGQVRVTSQGRSGDVVITLPDGDVRFWWEFGGGDCLVIIQVPDAQQWKQTLLHHNPRHEFLEALAAEVTAQQCPGASHTISETFIAFYR
jgi:hypothetical protein